eukprot:5984889-Lingulodinium_polyedra.AAC.1
MLLDLCMGDIEHERLKVSDKTICEDLIRKLQAPASTWLTHHRRLREADRGQAHDAHIPSRQH